MSKAWVEATDKYRNTGSNARSEQAKAVEEIGRFLNQEGAEARLLLEASKKEILLFDTEGLDSAVPFLMTNSGFVKRILGGIKTLAVGPEELVGCFVSATKKPASELLRIIRYELDKIAAAAPEE